MNHHIVYPDADQATAALFTGDRMARIHALGSFDLHVGEATTDSETIERIGDADAVILGWAMSDAVLSALPHAKIIAFTGIGAANHVNLKLATELGITVTNTPGYANDTVAEHTIALMLGLSRQIARLDRDTRAGGWNHGVPTYDLRNKTLGLIGLGGIGTRTAQLANAFGMRVMAWTRNPSDEKARAAGVTFASLETVMSESDVLSLHLELNDQTEGMIDGPLLGLMQSDAYFINTARGEIVDEIELARLLESGRLAGAGLDVFSQEPLPKDHIFRHLENVLITPHTGFNTPEANAAIMDIAVESLEAYFAGTPINVVT
jgi:phosphoglycerate dehydrogenase-like enzyme